MIYGCGIDIEEINRFNKHYFHKGKLSNLIYDLFTLREIDNFSIYGKEAFLKGFSFKEAFYKALGYINIGFKDIELIFKNSETVEIYKSNKLKRVLKDLNIIEIKTHFQETDQYVISKVLLMNKN